jgi:hypothetical protein
VEDDEVHPLAFRTLVGHVGVADGVALPVRHAPQGQLLGSEPDHGIPAPPDEIGDPGLAKLGEEAHPRVAPVQDEAACTRGADSP